MGVEPALLKILETECASLGASFRSAGGTRVVAEPSGRVLLAKLSTPSAQVLGEAASLSCMRAALPEASTLVPAMHASGEHADGRAYLVTDYLDMHTRLSPRAQTLLGQRLARMHQHSASPDGRFGFQRPTFCGATQQDNTWTDSWSTFWAERRIAPLIKRINDPTLAALEAQMRDKVYPLLLHPLDGKVKPAILHGDLWSGNVGERKNPENEPGIFDPASYYGHNEAELGIMHMFGGFTPDFFEAYHKVLPRCEPYYDERVKLYELYHHLNHAAMFGGGYRAGAVGIMRSLIDFAEQQTDKAGL